MSSLGKDTTESDLWAFDDDTPPAAPPIPSVPRDQSSKETPAKRAARKKEEENPDGPKTSSKTPPEPASHPVNKRKSSPDPAFEELEAWDESPPEQDTEPVLKLTPEKPKAAPSPPPKPPPEPVAPEKVVAGDPAAAENDEFTPTPRADAVPAAMPKLGLTRIERLGLGALMVLLLGGGVFLVTNSLGLLPARSAQVESGDFPIQGKRLTVVTAKSFWREPITTGAAAESFRRGTRLIPAVDFSVEGGPAAVRIFFKNAQGDLVGDPVTRAVGAKESKITVAASAGFDDIGLHAAYRAGESKPWTIEVHEGPSVDAAGDEFKKLFEMTVSTERR